MSNRDIQLKSNSGIIKMSWIILLICIGVLLISIFFIRENYKNTRAQLEFLKLVDQQELAVQSLSESCAQIVRSNDFSQETHKSLMDGVEDIKKINSELTTLEYLPSLHGNIEKVNVTYLGIIDLVLNNEKEVLDNREVIQSQLLSNTQLYMTQLRHIRNWSLDKNIELNKSIYIWLGISDLIYIALLVFAYLFVIKPLRSNFEQFQLLITKWKSKVRKSESTMNLAINKEKESSLLLKTKVAQVIKLQESLKVAISTANQVKQDKNLVYFNAATDLGDYLKVLNRQKEILENQTNIAQQIGWSTLTSTIAQLNAMVGDYFNQSKLGQANKNQREVYLSQLISEILISTSGNEKVEFEQVADMPTVKTDVELLKRVLLPYFELISKVELMGKVKISVIEDGSTCEIKFMGLTNTFKEALVGVENKELADLDFDEYKIHMSKNTIEERGGKQWIQAMKKHNGVFIISWVL